MPPPFRKLTIDQFRQEVRDFRFSFDKKQVHVHHTYLPNHTNERARGAEKCVQGMFNYHTEHNGWSDIAQHVTIDSTGHIWTGRPWNKAPASSKGFNGAPHFPFMFEMIGDFEDEETGDHDELSGAQLNAAYAVCGIICDRFKLKPKSTVKFHRELGEKKSCPGNLVDKDQFVSGVMKWMTSNGLTPRV